MLRGFPFPLAIHLVGDVDPIGTAVFLGSGARYACPASKFMLHGISRSFRQSVHPGQPTEEGLRRALLNVTADGSRISAVIGQRTTLPEHAIAELFRQQRRLTAAEAVTAGIVHKVKDLQTPPGRLICTVDPGD